MNKYMKIALEEAREGMNNNHGGPFGCVIVKDDKIVGQDHNRVLLSNDPTWHSEIGAIRDACKNLNTYDLTGCTVYVTGEPCPMCLCACLWANIDKIYYGCTLLDNEKIGFRDYKFDTLLGKRNVGNYLETIDREECLKLFEEYNQKNDKIIY